MKKTSRIYILLLSCFIAINTYSQSSSSIDIPKYKENMLNPQAALMDMYANYPVDLSSGLVNISIPLCEIKTPHLTLPINIKYHASGLKADEREGLLGLRWLLDVTYSINRSMKGYPDDGFFEGNIYPFDNRVNDPGYTPDLATKWGTTAVPGDGDFAIDYNDIQHVGYDKPVRYMDTQYDIFSYHLPSGKSGKFILKDSAGIKIPQTLPYEPIKIELISKKEYLGYNQIIITDENGIVYNYGKTIHLSVSKEDIDIRDGIRNFATSWRLNAIISANKKDTITFEYKYFPLNSVYRYASLWHVRNNSTMYEYINPSEEFNTIFHDELRNQVQATEHIVVSENTGVYNDYNQYCLSQINFRGGKVLFDYSQLLGNIYLSSMVVHDSNLNIAKRIELSYKRNVGHVTGVDSNNPVLLDKLSFIDNNSMNNSRINYSFDYYDTYSYPAGEEIQSDWWGYYSRNSYNVLKEDNIKLATPLIHPTYPLPQTSIIYKSIGNSAYKDSQVSDMKIGMLKAIEYPTGGKTLYEYDSNYYVRRGNQYSEPCGGLRIRSVENIPADGKSEFKTYKYNPSNDQNYDGAGNMPEYLYPPKPIGSNDKNYFEKKQIIIDYNNFDNSSYIVNSVVNGDYFHTIYSNLLPSQFIEFHSNIVYYDKVIEYDGTETSNSGYTEYYYNYKLPEYTEYPHSYIYDEEPNSERQHIHVLPSQFGESSSLLYRKCVFNKENELINEFIYDYSPYNKGSIYDMPIKRYMNYKIGGNNLWPWFRPKLVELMYVESSSIEDFSYLNQEYKLGASRLTKETTKTYTPQGTVITTKEIEYDPLHLLPVKETQTTSVNNDKLSRTFKYPYQYTQEPYIAMTKRNILSPVIETNILKNGNFQEKGITNYKNWFADMYAPLNFQYQQQGSTLETRLLYDYNDQGQLRAAVKDGARKVVYIRNAYSQPLAVIDQADYTEVETILGKTFIERLAKSFTVSDADMATLHTLRSKLSNAQVTVYTYKPLVGITSVTDPRGIKTTYEYDNSNRLEYIRDSEGNPVESYNYHFSNQ